MRIAFAIVLSLAGTSVAAQAIEGHAVVIDGDTIEVSGVRIRLQGVAAPEMREAGGPESKAMLREIIGASTVQCMDTGERTHKRVVAFLQRALC
jgi:micrococcal nuclease